MFIQANLKAVGVIGHEDAAYLAGIIKLEGYQVIVGRFSDQCASWEVLLVITGPIGKQSSFWQVKVPSRTGTYIIYIVHSLNLGLWPVGFRGCQNHIYAG